MRRRCRPFPSCPLSPNHFIWFQLLSHLTIMTSVLCRPVLRLSLVPVGVPRCRRRCRRRPFRRLSSGGSIPPRAFLWFFRLLLRPVLVRWAFTAVTGKFKKFMLVRTYLKVCCCRGLTRRVRLVTGFPVRRRGHTLAVGRARRRWW